MFLRHPAPPPTRRSW